MAAFYELSGEKWPFYSNVAADGKTTKLNEKKNNRDENIP